MWHRPLSEGPQPKMYFAVQLLRGAGGYASFPLTIPTCPLPKVGSVSERSERTMRQVGSDNVRGEAERGRRPTALRRRLVPEAPFKVGAGVTVNPSRKR